MRVVGRRGNEIPAIVTYWFVWMDIRRESGHHAFGK
jgi:hypothetical protein